MSGVNKVHLLGRLGKSPELQTTQNGMAICKFSMATSRKQKNGEEVTQWHRLTAFQKSAELINQYVKKGDMLYVEGEINYSQYEKDGQARYSTDIIVREFNFIGGGQGGQQNQQQGQQNQGYQPQNQNQQQGYQPPQPGPAQGCGYQTPGQPPPTQNQYGQPGQPGHNQGNQPPIDDTIPF